MHTEYPIIEIPSNVPIEQEMMGTKKKFWFQDEKLGKCLYKIARPETGEDWSEKVAAELCGLLMLPYARYELAKWCDPVTREATWGVLTPSFLPSETDLIPGNELLLAQDPQYPASQRFNVSQHTFNAVCQVLLANKAQLPPDWLPVPGIQTAAEVFIGYLLLDAWIGNTDRHHQNWAVILWPDRKTQLAPTHDHAASLGAILKDERRKRHLTTKDSNDTVSAYAARGRSALHESDTNPKPLLLLDAFAHATAQMPQSANIWLERLAAVTDNDVAQVFQCIPAQRISLAATAFAKMLLSINRQHLLELKERIK